MTFLIAHTAPNGTNCAQAVLDAENEYEAKVKFASTYPGRTLTVIVGIRH